METITELTDEELDLVAGGAGGNQPPPPTSNNGATLIGGRPPEFIETPSGKTIEPGTGPVTLRR
jgi:hypothetical protein